MLKNYLKEDTKLIELAEKDNIVSVYEEFCDYSDQLAMHLFIETGINMAPAIHLINKWYKINDKWYLFKKDCDDLFVNFSLNELLGEYISKYFELEAAHYELAAELSHGKNEQIGLLTENFIKQNTEYWTPDQYISRNFRQGMNIFDYLGEIATRDEEFGVLLADVKKLFIRDFFAGERDRRYRNLLLKGENNIVSLAPIYDNEECFFLNDDNMHINENCLGRMDITDEATRNLLVRDDYFQYLLDKLMVFDMKMALGTVEATNGILIPNEEKNIYIEHTNKIKRLVKGNNLIKKL